MINNRFLEETVFAIADGYCVINLTKNYVPGVMYQVIDGKMKKIDSAAVVDAMQKVSKMEVPAWFGSPISLVIGWLLIIGVIGSVILSICDMVSVNFALWWVLVQYMVVFFVCKQTLDKIDSTDASL